MEENKIMEEFSDKVMELIDELPKQISDARIIGEMHLIANDLTTGEPMKDDGTEEETD